MSDELVAFLRARLDEDEQDARETAGDEAHQRWALDESPDYNEGAIVSDALWHLRDVEAKRRIVELGSHSLVQLGAAGGLWELTLRLLALRYAGHPDYPDDASS